MKSPKPNLSLTPSRPTAWAVLAALVLSSMALSTGCADQPIQIAQPTQSSEATNEWRKTTQQDQTTGLSGQLQQEKQPTQSSVQTAPAPQDTTTMVSGAPVWPIVHGYGQYSLEERIVYSEVVARVRLLGVASVGKYEESESGDHFYISALEFRFNALEYLKGSGGDEITALATESYTRYETVVEARTLGEDFLGERDTQWDDREAIVFLIATQEPDRYWFGTLSEEGRDGYTIASPYNKVWLPAASAGTALPKGAGNGPGGEELVFLTDIPDAATASGPPSIRSLGASSSDASGRAPTITLSELKSLIEEVEREVSAGGGSEEYRECIRFKYRWERDMGLLEGQ